MGKLPYITFFSGDWMKDPRLSLCSPATRGIWIDFICSMHELDHCGVISGDRDQLSRIGRCSVVQLDHALIELSTSGTADLTERNGIITLINRRMKREYKERENNKLRQQRYYQKHTSNENLTTSLSSSSSISSSNKEKEILKKEKYGSFSHVLLTNDEYQKLQEKFNSDLKEWIRKLDEGIEMKGYKYKSHYLAILKWAEREKTQPAKSTGSRSRLLDDYYRKPEKYTPHYLPPDPEIERPTPAEVRALIGSVGKKV